LDGRGDNIHEDGIVATKNFYRPDALDVLFCKCDGTTTSFVDSSTANPKTITANGNATQLALATGVTSRTAGFFNGTTDYVVVPDSADWDFGTGDFEIDLRFNTASVAADLVFVDRSDFKFFWDQSEGKYGCTLEGTAHLSSASTPTVNTWYRVKAKRVSGTLTFYVDEVATGTADASADDIAGTSAVYIGATTTPNTFYSGWLKNLTITKASTLVLDMRFDSPATSPLGPAIAFDGTGDYLTTTHDAIGTNPFTVEGFFNFNSAGTMDLIGQGDGAGQWRIRRGADGKLKFTIAGGDIVYFTWSPTANKWYHIAVTRNATTMFLFIDGVLVHSVGNTTNISSASNINIGYVDAAFAGSMREILITNTCKYANPFTPSQSGFTVDANTKLYIKRNKNNGVTTFVDSSTSPKTVTTAGDTKIKYTEDYRSCIFKDETGKFPYPVGSAKVDFFTVSGSGVGYFDGANGTYLSVADSADWDMTDFTIETYFRTGGNGNYNLIDFPSSQLALAFYGNNASYTFDGTVGATRVNQTSPVPPINTWTHYALVRSGTNAYCFKDGTLLGTVNVGTTATAPSALNIGSNGTWGSGFLGLLDNIRISKGVARYTASFNPPEPKLSGNKLIMWVN